MVTSRTNYSLLIIIAIVFSIDNNLDTDGDGYFDVDEIKMGTDPEALMKKWIRPTGYPCLILVDQSMDLKIHALRGIEDSIDETYRILGKDK